MKKIMFNDKYGLTKAVLEGKKTQTRRVVPKDFFSLNWDVKERTLVYENDFGDLVDIRNSKYALLMEVHIENCWEYVRRMDEQNVRQARANASPNPHYSRPSRAFAGHQR